MILLLLCAPVLGQQFSPPAASPATDQALRSIRENLATSPAGLAGQVEDLLKEHADDLVPARDGLISASAYLRTLPAEQLAPLQAEYRQAFDPAARRALDAARQDPSAPPEAFHAIARRYPLSSIVATAEVEAGDRAARLGDAPATVAYFHLAMRAGWQIDPEHAKTLEAARASLQDRPDAYRGQVVFDATWYGRSELAGMPRYFPFACDGLVYFTAPKQVLCLKETGQLVWRYSTPDAWTHVIPPDRKWRGTPYTPVIFSSPTAAQILVARAPRIATPDFLLRAFRASDGKLLWSTADDPAFEHLSIISSPALAGRFLYCAAVDFTDNPGTLALLAMNLLDGRLRFKCTLGTLGDAQTSRQESPLLEPLFEQTEPAVAGDAVYLTPNVGAAFCVDRFDGRLRWTHRYPVDPSPLRYRTTPAPCRDALVIAPQDSSQIMGLNLQTGQQLWALPLPSTLFAQADSAAFLAGPSIHALEAATGKQLWHWSPPGHARITGPPALANGSIHVPLSGFRIQALSALRGEPVEARLRQPNFRQLLASDAGHKALEEASISRSLGLPAATGAPAAH